MFFLHYRHFSLWSESFYGSPCFDVFWPKDPQLFYEVYWNRSFYCWDNIDLYFRFTYLLCLYPNEYFVSFPDASFDYFFPVNGAGISLPKRHLSATTEFIFLVAVQHMVATIWKLGAQNCQLLTFWASYFPRETTIYSDYNHKHVPVSNYWNKA